MANFTEMFEITIRIPKSGFQWVKARKRNQPASPEVLKSNASNKQKFEHSIHKNKSQTSWFLVPADLMGREIERIERCEVSPFGRGDKAVFIKFAYLLNGDESPEETRNKIVEFSNKYGFLGFEQNIWILREEEAFTGGKGEALKMWQEEIFILRESLELWDATKYEEINELKKRITFRNGYFTIKSSEGEQIERYRVRKFPTLEKNSKSGNLLKTARFHLSKTVTSRLSNSISPHLYLDDEFEKFGIDFPIPSLRGAIWFQFAQDIASNVGLRDCLGCRKPISVSRSREDRKCHGATCRKRVSRDRKKAERLFQKGRSFDEIYDSLKGNEPRELVEKWLKQCKKN